MSYNYRNEVEQQLIDSFPLEIACRCSLKRIVRLSCKLLHINLFECALLSWLLKRSKYDFTNLMHSSSHIKMVDE